jgi:hypothetical protein
MAAEYVLRMQKGVGAIPELHFSALTHAKPLP